MPDRVLVRFANISAAPLDLAVSPDMTVGQLKEIVWGGWPEAKTKEAESEVPYAKLRITGHGRGEFLRDSQVLGDTSVYMTKGSVALTTPDGSAVHLMALYRSNARPVGGGRGRGASASAAPGSSTSCCTCS
ncbi:hypothetical protein FNF29_00569 [Cafeteria roenbergensis]|uniref:UBL3-like ubiquitin domain-containing protein n=1 Tax=Cafeteria roenbergensis TaxID=33653 RepID=A0A5A8CXP8_CAFRO|nr:hypothetical protein FNF29_00569 [Cafeteria roenbergensis]|eukprot:KAA0157217.1 hypothetical protein FNF29_00569 [Cafeteria roenbergensis]